MTMRWAMIGTGRVNQQMARAMNDTDDVLLHGVLSRDVDTAHNFAAEYQIPRTYHSLDSLLSDTEVDVVYVASPNGLHREQVLAIAQAGKHILCEKPMANDIQSCQEMISACRANGVEIGIAFQYRQHKAHREIRELVSTGKLGNVVFADAAVHIPPLATPSWYSNPGIAGGGVLPMSGVHRIDLLRYVLGAEVEEVVAFIDSRLPGKTYEDTVAALLRFDNGTVATVRFALEARSGGEGISLHGSAGWAVADRTTSQWWGDDGGELSFSNGDTTSNKVFARDDLYLAQVEEFTAALNGGARFSASAVDGLRAAEITAALFESGRDRKTVRVKRSVVAEHA